MGIGDLFKPKWRHSNREIRLAAVLELKDQAALASVVNNESDEEIRQAAMERIRLEELTDQTLLAFLSRPSSKARLSDWAYSR